MQTRPRINKNLYDKVKLNGMTFNQSLAFRIAHDELMIKLKDRKIEKLQNEAVSTTNNLYDYWAEKLTIVETKYYFALALSICFGLFIAGDKLGLFEFIGGLING